MNEIIHRTRASRRDLLLCLVYLERTAGAATADRFLSTSEACFRRLAANPGLGERVLLDDPQLADLRTASMGTKFRRYAVYDRPIPGGIEVVRLLHTARGVDAILRGDPGLDDFEP